MTYAGEHALAGTTGHVFVIISFVAALLAGIAWYNSSKTPENYLIWIKTARRLFFVHVAASLVFIGMVFYLLISHYYEYQYIWEQSNGEMSFRHLLICFWGGQQGSFMLWIFWHLVLGSILVFTAKKFEPHVMAVFCLVQVFLVSMLLGIYLPFGSDVKLGESPFALRRQLAEGMGPLWNLIPDYLTFDDTLQKGKGLNPLLRNYWMTIHPPTLFLGFALTVVPFCYAIAALWTKRLTEWIKPALPWTFVGIMVLGGGILMGGRWAYESLTFGGFWAWDPVENASLVPWIILVGAGHLMLINRHTQNSLYSTFVFTLFAFIFILLSTFLTRSGILGEASVHSFTGNDMMGQLLLYMMFFTWLSLHLLNFNKKLRIWLGVISGIILLLSVFSNTGYLISQFDLLGQTISITPRSIMFSWGLVFIILFLIFGYAYDFPKSKEAEENFSAREFWMFIAAILLSLSAFHIIWNTSLPALNDVYGTKMSILQDERNGFYNLYQVPFAIIISLIVAFAQFLKYKKTDGRKFFKEILVSFGISMILTGVLLPQFGLGGEKKHILLLFTSVFAIVANLDYFIRLMKGKLNHLGASIAHVGFALVLLGSLVSQAKQQVISKNYKGYHLDLLDKDRSILNEQDVQLFKGELTSMGEYFVVYTGKTFDNKNGFLYFNIDYLEQLPKTYKQGDRFVYGFMLYECNTTHPARNTFMEERSFWKPVEAATSEEFYSYPVWESHRPGKKLFSLTPFLQLTTSGRSVEPGTKNFWSHDIFTHLKHGNLSPANTNKMSPITMEGSLGDTMLTAGYKIRIDGARQDSTLVDSTYKRDVELTLSIFGIMDHEWKYPVLAKPVMKNVLGDKPESPVYEVKPLGIEFRLKNIIPPTIDTTGFSQGQKPKNVEGKFELEYVTKEYVVLHARTFPMIIILWWGCIIMCLGTLMAVIHRIRKNKIAKT